MRLSNNEFAAVCLNEAITILDDYTYQDYKNDMYKIGKAIQETARELYESYLNEDSSSSGSSPMEKLKEIWYIIVESFKRMANKLYDWIYEQVVLHKNFIMKNKEKILTNTVPHIRSNKNEGSGK